MENIYTLMNKNKELMESSKQLDKQIKLVERVSITMIVLWSIALSLLCH